MTGIPSETTSVKIPVRVRNGAITFFYPGPLPRIREGAVADLVIERSFVLDKPALARLEYEEDRELLPSGSELRVVVSPRTTQTKATPRDSSKEPMNENRATHFVVIQALEPIILRLRGTKAAMLRPSRFQVPLLNEERTTLNQAYSLIAENFEPWRNSTTGNVFKKVLFRKDHGGEARWRKLEDLRDAAEADLEARLYRPQLELLHSSVRGITER